MGFHGIDNENFMAQTMNLLGYHRNIDDLEDSMGAQHDNTPKNILHIDELDQVKVLFYGDITNNVAIQYVMMA